MLKKLANKKKIFGHLLSGCEECISPQNLDEIQNQGFEKYVKCKIKFFQCLKNKERCKDQLFAFIIIVLGMSIPFLSALITDEYLIQKNQLTVSIGTIIAIITAYIQIKRYHERWIIFKIVSRTLEFELIRFKNNMFSNENEENIKLFRNKVFEILYNEVDQIASIFKNTNNDKLDKDNH